MARTNQFIKNNTFGDEVKFLVTSEDSQGKLLKAELLVKPGGGEPPSHYHPIQSETFTITSGEMNLIHNGKEIILKAGQSYTVPPNTPHKFWNGSKADAVAIVELKPALKTEFFLETLYALDKQGKTNKEGLPNLLQFSAILNETYGEFFVVGPPIFAQKFIAKVVGWFAKTIGYKGYIPFPKN
ncbi:cupin domain-containing protein [Flavobacterium sp.]|uniref:cupin domain-containing protein n=1 Tax=Flavobacterium sp. TaxID=239 RepID=UPI003751CE5F